MPKRLVNDIELHHWQGTWYTRDGRFQIAAEGIGVARCTYPHLRRNGMMCQGEEFHTHNTWWVWDSENRNHVFGNRCFDRMSDAVAELAIRIEQEDV